jgi:ribonuclease HI
VTDHQRNIQSRILGHQTIARAEALGILAALLASRRDTDLKIHRDRLSLVDQLNKYQLRPPFDFKLKDIQDRSIILHILHEVCTHIGTTKFTHVKAHKPDTMSDTPFEMSTMNKQHQELNKIADKLAKGSLSQPSATIPFGCEFLPSVSVCVNHGHGTYVFKNQAHKLFTKHYKSLKKHYHFRGQWHRHLFTDAIWQEASLHILHSKLSTTGSLREFIVQVLGRTLPTFHHLHKIRPQLYLKANCPLCSSSNKTIEHLLFHCPFFTDARKTALTASIEPLKSQQITATAQELHDALHSHIFHPLFDERSFSASQLPTSFRQ